MTGLAHLGEDEFEAAGPYGSECAEAKSRAPGRVLPSSREVVARLGVLLERCAHWWP